VSSDSFLIELRIGYPRWKLIEPINTVAKKFHLTLESPRVPHMSLYGSFQIKDGFSIRDVKKAIESVSVHYDYLSYIIDGWDFKKGREGWVIAFKILPSPELERCKTDLVHNLLKISEPKNSWDYYPEKAWYHITLAFKLTDGQYNKIVKELQKQKVSRIGLLQKFFPSILQTFTDPNRLYLHPLLLPVDAFRITILHRSLIAAEYDLVTKRWLNRSDAKSTYHLGNTLKNYRIKKGIELTRPHHYTDKTIFTLADLHLGHSNIIKYCCRPFLFSDINEMDSVLINNWNNTIKPHDIVFYVGDISLNSHQSYISKLNGNITFIQGNHDSQIPSVKDFFEYNYHGIDFLFIHDPKHAPKNYPGWIIHGHEHNNKIRKYPFFDPVNRKINVGVELVKYQPVRLKYIYDLIMNKHETIPYCE
jgi:calcineurin-like phosphoesterase family protein